nr:metallophosphoesterase [Kibdelosporangium sp. MJ126-NF4]CEL14233.1 putative SimX4 homolog [Kibdelosporangium sp. MJ126-NF4]CTQ88601.1 putative SimX4 homolog [Kibdelosporangium sp. MJ126-NF4]
MSRLDSPIHGDIRPTGPSLLAVSDLHIGHKANRELCEQLRPRHPGDWLIVAGDIAEQMAEVEWALRLLADRFTKVIWVPGNHELWTHPNDPCQLRGVQRYEHLVALCRSLGVDTPEDPFPVFWDGEVGVTVAPLFTLFDYTMLPPGTSTKDAAFELARSTGVVCTDEFMLHPDPYPTREAWCAARIEYSQRRLAGAVGPTVLVNHWPLVRDPLVVLRNPEFSLWCGTTATADWAYRYDARAVVYGHLHIPRTISVNGVPHVEASIGYPFEWRRYGMRPELYVDVFDPVRPNIEFARARDRRHEHIA